MPRQKKRSDEAKFDFQVRVHIKKVKIVQPRR